MCFGMLSKMKTTEAGEGVPSGRNCGAWIGLQVSFKTRPPSHSVQASAALPRFSERTGVVQLFLLTPQRASLNQSQTCGHGGIVLSQLLGWIKKLPQDFLNIYPAIFISSTKTVVPLNWKSFFRARNTHCMHNMSAV